MKATPRPMSLYPNVWEPWKRQPTPSYTPPSSPTRKLGGVKGVRGRHAGRSRLCPPPRPLVPPLIRFRLDVSSVPVCTGATRKNRHSPQPREVRLDSDTQDSGTPSRGSTAPPPHAAADRTPHPPRATGVRRDAGQWGRIFLLGRLPLLTTLFLKCRLPRASTSATSWFFSLCFSPSRPPPPPADPLLFPLRPPTAPGDRAQPLLCLLSTDRSSRTIAQSSLRLPPVKAHVPGGPRSFCRALCRGLGCRPAGLPPPPPSPFPPPVSHLRLPLEIPHLPSVATARGAAPSRLARCKAPAWSSAPFPSSLKITP